MSTIDMQAAIKWLVIGQQVFERGREVWEPIKAVLDANGIATDNVALDKVILDAERRKAQAQRDANGTTGE